jgi:AraC family transcriptional activator of pyochelin receptor
MDFDLCKMDKINLADYRNYFGCTGQIVLHASERYAETMVRFEEPGRPSGNIRVIATPGLTLTEFHLTTNRPIQLNDMEEKEAAESAFILKGNIESCFQTIKAPVRFTSQQHNIQYNTNFAGEHVIHSSDFHALTISYDLAFLNGLLQSDETNSLHVLRRSIEKKHNFLAAPLPLTWQGCLADAVQAIRNCKFQGLTRYILIESKMMELFALQIEHLNTVHSHCSKEKWSSSDKEKLFAVKECLEQSYLEAVTLRELTYRFGLNEFKLKKGYKHFFGTTVFGHIHHLRMQKAKSLLLEKQMNVSEVADYIGYDNLSSFSAEFKKRFGLTPSGYLN